LRVSAQQKRGATVLAWVDPERYGVIEFDAEPMIATSYELTHASGWSTSLALVT
jgi:dTDP-glucose pyrophosphorylase